MYQQSFLRKLNCTAVHIYLVHTLGPFVAIRFGQNITVTNIVPEVGHIYDKLTCTCSVVIHEAVSIVAGTDVPSIFTCQVCTYMIASM